MLLLLLLPFVVFKTAVGCRCCWLLLKTIVWLLLRSLFSKAAVGCFTNSSLVVVAVANAVAVVGKCQ